MNWYKKANAPFQTFNIENKITEAFINAYNLFIQKNKNSNKLNEYKTIHIGSIHTNILKPIIDHYGQPKTPMPEYIDFFLMNKNHPMSNKNEQNKQNESAFFMIWEGRFIIGKKMDDITDFKNSEDFKYSIQHELQHFLKAIYEGKESPEYTKIPKKQRTKEEYFGDPWEIQSYSQTIAKKAMDDIKDLYSFRTQNTPQQNIPNIKTKITNSKDMLINKFLLMELRNFFDKSKANLNPDARKQYYLSTMKIFNRLFQQFVSEL